MPSAKGCNAIEPASWGKLDKRTLWLAHAIRQFSPVQGPNTEDGAAKLFEERYRTVRILCIWRYYRSGSANDVATLGTLRTVLKHVSESKHISASWVIDMEDPLLPQLSISKKKRGMHAPCALRRAPHDHRGTPSFYIPPIYACLGVEGRAKFPTGKEKYDVSGVSRPASAM